MEAKRSNQRYGGEIINKRGAAQMWCIAADFQWWYLATGGECIIIKVIEMVAKWQEGRRLMTMPQASINRCSLFVEKSALWLISIRAAQCSIRRAVVA